MREATTSGSRHTHTHTHIPSDLTYSCPQRVCTWLSWSLLHVHPWPAFYRCTSVVHTSHFTAPCHPCSPCPSCLSPLPHMSTCIATFSAFVFRKKKLQKSFSWNSSVWWRESSTHSPNVHCDSCHPFFFPSLWRWQVTTEIRWNIRNLYILLQINEIKQITHSSCSKDVIGCTGIAISKCILYVHLSIFQ